MAKILRLRRGTAAQHNSFTGLEGEITVDTTNDTIRVHDNVTVGGHILASKEYVDDIVVAIESGNINLGNIDIIGNEITTIGTNEDLQLATNGTGNVVIIGANLHLEDALSSIRIGPDDELRLRLQTDSGRNYGSLTTRAGANHDLLLSAGNTAIYVEHNTYRVGINTNTPTVALDVLGTIKTGQYIANNSVNGGVTGGYTFPYDDGYTGIYHYRDQSNSVLKIIHDNRVSMVIEKNGDLEIIGNLLLANKVSTFSTNEDLILDPNGSGQVVVSGSIVPMSNITYSLGSPLAKWDSLYVSSITGNTAGFAIGYRDIPQVSLTGNVTIDTTDAGKHFYSTQSTDYILTIANNASQSFQVGAAITVVNQGTGNITVAQGSGVTLYLAGNANAGNRSVTTYGMATIMKVATDTWFINGTGVS